MTFKINFKATFTFQNRLFVLEHFNIYGKTVKVIQSSQIPNTQFCLLLISYTNMVDLLQLMNHY